MTLDDLLHTCARAGIKMAVENGSLRVRAPAGAVTPELRRVLETQKPALLAHFSTIPAPGEIVPLSAAQRSLWLLHESEPESLPAYTLRAARRFRGALDAARLERALRRVIARHDPLRTRFYERGGEPWQQVRPEVAFTLEHSDLSALSPAEREAGWQAKLAEEGRRRFDVRATPLFTVQLVRLAADEHALLLNAHHLIADAWSAGLLLREMAAAYAADTVDEASSLVGTGERRGEDASSTTNPASLPAFRFSDHVHEQRRRHEQGGATAALAYWQKQLVHTPALGLPTDHARGATAGYAGASEGFVIDAETAATLRTLARAEGATLFHALLGAFSVLLQRLSGQDDFAIGTTLAGRDRREAEDLVGYFVQLVALRSELAGEPGFRELLRRTRTSVLAAFQHQEAPFDQIVHALRLPRDRASHPIFQVLFLYLQAARDASSFPGLVTESLPVPSVTSKYDLSLNLEDQGDRITGLIEFNTALFTPATIRRFIATWQALLRGLAASPDVPVARVDALDASEAQRVLRDFNASATDYPAAQDLVGAFRAQARQTPSAIALVHEDRSLTYAQLDAATDRLAAKLRAQGVGPDRIVALCAERSLEMVVGLLATLKAGGAYLPLDPAYPADRLSFMLGDARPAALLTTRRQRHTLPPHTVPGISLDGVADAPASGAPLPPLETSGASPDRLAYVIYTSGSTGKPKGVMVTHRNAINFFAGMDAQLGRQPGTWLALTSISFDISVLELWWTLTRGFKVVLQSEDEKNGAAASTSASEAAAARPIDFSLFYFSGDAAQPHANKYRLLLEGSKFADDFGFAAVWTPERHFHAFGGLFPNPAVLGAALATATQRVQIRAGSVVLPLHDPVRVAEEWSVVDNLSGGRVGVSFASGWHHGDFIFAPHNYAERRRVMFENLHAVRALWRGETITRTDGRGAATSVQILPRPAQSELPVWITAGGDPETFRLAGEAGANLLTHLLGQSPEDLTRKITLYREAWRAAGHAGDGHVTVMLHTYIGRDLAEVRARVRGPFREYLRSSVDLIASVAKTLGLDLRAPDFKPDDLEAVLDHAFERYFETSALMGTPQSCLPMVRKLQAMTADEIACLIDFGVGDDAALEALPLLAQLKDNVRDAAATRRSIAEQFARHAPTHLQATPSRLKMLLLDEPAAEALRGLQRLVVGGEAVPPSLATELATRIRGEVHNLYGPTETTVWSTGHRIAANDRTVLIGRPIANTEVYVLDRHLAPVLIGVAGELFIGGIGVTRGYLNRPELTADRFVPDAFGRSGGRLYRTGDLARWHADGTLECLGRADHQVKILGHRIEPGEIETALAKHPGVRAAAVTAPADERGERRLVAYYEAKTPEAAPQPAELRAFLRRDLPEHLVPAVFVFLPALPLTPNGKIDRRALPAPAAEAAVDAGFVAPRTPEEEIVASLWSQLLGRAKIGAHDQFFELGGHSLLAMQMIARLRQTTGIDLPLRSLFEAPTVAGVATRIAASLRGGETDNAPPFQPAARGARVPLSFGQRRLWFIEQLEPGRSTFNVPAAIRLRGPCDYAALEATFNALVERHETLRTRFIAPDGEPMQQIDPAGAVRFTLTLEDLTEFPPEERESRAKTRADDEACAVFDLAQGPAFRVRLLKIDEREHLLVFVMHHIVSDGWTIGLLTREIGGLYAARATGVESPLPPLAAQFADYAAWQNHWFTSEVLARKLAYWKEHLAGAVAAEIPSDRPRPRVLDGIGREYHTQWPPDLAQGLRQLAQREGATLFMTLFAGYTALLARYLRQENFVIGTSVANRPRPEFEAMVGFFVNLLPLRIDTSGNPTFSELIARVKKVCLAGYAHQDTPFEAMVEALAPGRDLSRTPLMQTELVLLNTPASPATLANLEITPVPLANRTSKLDVTLFAEEVGAGLRWIFEYRTELYNESTIARLAEHLRTLLAAAVAAPEQRIFQLPLLSAAEVAQQRAWNDVPQVFPTGRWIHEYPATAPADRTALIFGGKPMTYGEFNARTTALAALLAERGVGPEKLVGVYMERSFELLIALHAVMKAGGVYVPLDPSYPPERVAYMLADSKASVVLTVSALVAQMPATTATVLRLDDLPPAPAGWRPPVLHGESASYMIYTSGSTGRPKGALNTHAGILNMLQWMQSKFALTPEDRVLQITAYSFDVSVWELFWSLFAHSTLVVPEPGAHKDPARLIDIMVEERITAIHFVPSMLRAFLDTPGVERCTSLRHLICSGEELPREFVRRCHEAMPNVTVHNLYGPTEAAVDVSWHTCGRADAGPVPIGAPIPNLGLYVLDAAWQPVPTGVPGEVYLAGIHLGRGYHGRPELTADRWVPHPLATTPGERLYRTGDLGVQREDGEIVYLGRIDFQVKLRGFRIELGEIDAALRAHPNVSDATTILRNDPPAGDRLVGYIVAREREPSVAELRTWLISRLPEYMVPSAWVFLAEMPLSPAGKTDRRALPAPKQDRGAELVAPRNDDEALVAAIWAEVLGREAVGATDDFFELGGHSLLATQVMIRVRERAGAALPLRTIFEQTTVESFARAVQAARAATATGLASAALRRTKRERRRVNVNSDGELDAVNT